MEDNGQQRDKKEDIKEDIKGDIKKKLLTDIGELLRGGEVYEEGDMLSLDISGEDIQKVASLLRLGEGLEFSLLVDILGIDYSEYGTVRNKASDERYAVVYIFYSLIYDLRLKVRSFVKCAEKGVPTICGIYKGAILTEREVYDMYGINFVGHPDLKRLLMPEDYEGYPLRKDYPLRGRGERSSFPKYNIYNKLKGQVDGSG